MIAWTAIRALLGRVPMLAWALAAALAWGAVQRHQVTVEKAGKLKAVQELADLRLAAAQTTVTVLTTTIAGQQEAIHAAHDQTQAADVARVAVTGALGRLLERNRAAGRARAAAPAASGGQATDTAGVCPELLGETGRLAQRYAEIADKALIAGRACERSYEAFKP